ncbi:hypothetical protein [Nocardia sp. NPDC004604]|uniref:hypothetical protein n=1 Tax=Nocardia sp. NPDC004604 TaxID=3157013 RepID=UPI0033AA4E09
MAIARRLEHLNFAAVSPQVGVSIPAGRPQLSACARHKVRNPDDRMTTVNEQLW